jgi:hypothetical protein
MSSRILERYPRLVRVVQAVAEDSDSTWALQVVESASTHGNSSCKNIVFEAFRKRRLYPRALPGQSTTFNG